jgi:hypothetical protein
MDEEATIDMDPSEQRLAWSFCHKERMIPLRQKVGKPLPEMLCRNRVSQLFTQVRNLLRIVLGG